MLKKTLYERVFFPYLLVEKAEKMGQSMTKVPYKETFWKGTMRTRPREQHPHPEKLQDTTSYEDCYGFVCFSVFR